MRPTVRASRPPLSQAPPPTLPSPRPAAGPGMNPGNRPLTPPCFSSGASPNEASPRRRSPEPLLPPPNPRRFEPPGGRAGITEPPIAIRPRGSEPSRRKSKGPLPNGPPSPPSRNVSGGGSPDSRKTTDTTAKERKRRAFGVCENDRAGPHPPFCAFGRRALSRRRHPDRGNLGYHHWSAAIAPSSFSAFREKGKEPPAPAPFALFPWFPHPPCQMFCFFFVPSHEMCRSRRHAGHGAFLRGLSATRPVFLCSPVHVSVPVLSNPCPTNSSPSAERNHQPTRPLSPQPRVAPLGGPHDAQEPRTGVPGSAARPRPGAPFWVRNRGPPPSVADVLTAAPAVRLRPPRAGALGVFCAPQPPPAPAGDPPFCWFCRPVPDHSSPRRRVPWFPPPPPQRDGPDLQPGPSQRSGVPLPSRPPLGRAGPVFLKRPPAPCGPP